MSSTLFAVGPSLARLEDSAGLLATAPKCDAARLCVVVGTGAVEKAITQCNTLENRIAEKAVFDLSVGSDSAGNSRRCTMRKIIVLGREALTRPASPEI